MTPEEREAFARELRRRRALLLGEVADTEADLQTLSQEREAEWSDRAQEEQTAHVLSRLDVRDNEELAEIGYALDRIDQGVYGRCESCGQEIGVERLQAVPTARLCAACEQAGEVVVTEDEAGVDIPESGRVPPDMAFLSDEELTEAIYEQIREDGRVDTEELEVTVRNGVVILRGALPSEGERSILLQLVTDVLGFEEVVDLTKVSRLLWERADRYKTEEDFRLGERPAKPEGYGDDDTVESPEEGLGEVPPLGQPTAEEE
ncbi:MAG: TraR/DksA C4-type zinc finger protein [Thermodesulfobacteriota bacterium]|jgi:DnaK suppressor protein